MSVHTRADLEKISRFTRQRYSHALMSDTKWRKLFDAVNESDWLPSMVVVKFVESDQPASRPMRWPGPNSFGAPPQWIDTPEFGPIELRSIEWLLIPVTTIPPVGAQSRVPGPQDFAAIRTALAEVGQFPLEEGAEGMRIIGYR